MLLTIGMIVKNEEKNLEACLNGIKPILDRVDSELIIADTGSTDRTVEIAKKFTDNVFYFEWIKDFAAARNSTLEKAKGEWFMYIDGDEVFPSCEEIIEFFNSGEYKLYNSASYIQRNYAKVGDKGFYSDFKAPRLTRILSNTKFINPIHEVFNTYGYPVKFFGDFVDHFGYATGSNVQKKSETYKNMLLKRLEDDGESPLIYSQLADCYRNSDKEKWKECILRGIELSYERNDALFVTFYAELVYMYFSEGNYEEVIRVSDEYYSRKPDDKVLCTETEIAVIRAISLTNLNEYEKAINDYVKFFILFDLFKDNKLNTREVTITVFSIAVDYNFLCVVFDFVKCCIAADRYELAANYLKKLPLAEYSLNVEYVKGVVDKALAVLKHFNYKNPKEYYQQFDEAGKKLFRESLCRLVIIDDDKKAVIKALKEVAGNDDIAVKAAAVYENFYNGKPVNIAEFLKTDLSDYPEMLYIAFAAGQDISELLLNPDFNGREAVLKCYKYTVGFGEAVKNYSVDNIKNKAAIVPLAALYGYILRTMAELEVAIDNIPEVIAEIGGRYIAEFGDRDIDEQVSFAVALRKIQLFREAGDFRGCIAELRQFIIDYPQYVGGIKEYQSRIAAEYESAKPKSEMEMLIERIKNNIRGLINSGNLYSAAITLSEYKKINPADPDIEVLEEEIAAKSE